ncbi:magnesium/cobalt transporter CorA [Chloracidobacterium aggregatum]|uniref:magnesium/cobalt transporter CorA n=1 Tax=Chloracidobacterium aggregatum TaxID=2851959 RepID=UPI001B8AD9EA|nr:magnesium/cobalt transporter CorA [Chloracidobacterium aggregatum]QUV84167.1 magnesium/cobalt transporter CorA [Chloracidobacterium sp. 2]QUV87347.1 magnesium/cobalt transporter CorA [Chloracidobacterium sp. S]QUV90252.1 magnesium/cobalt transporter CorA [Chloracidobacterium sp. A]
MEQLSTSSRLTRLDSLHLTGEHRPVSDPMADLRRAATLRIHNGVGLRPVPEELTETVLRECWQMRRQRAFWLDLTAPTPAALQAVATLFGFHLLTVEDALSPEHRPKIDEHEDYLFMMFQSVAGISDETVLPTAGVGHCATNRLAVYLGVGFLVTVHDRGFAPVEEVAEIVDARDTTMDQHLDLVLHAIVDRMIDQVFPVLSGVEDRIQEIEAHIFTEQDQDVLPTVLKTKRELMTLRRLMGLQREMLLRLSRREDLPCIEAKTAIYFRDVYDHAVRLEETCVMLIELATNVAEAHLAVASRRTNEVMKFLTIFSTIWMPLTFIVGVYGMNFDYMPELKVWWFYPFLWVVMIGIVGGMLMFFRRKKWL